ncbi:MAG: histidine phosphatase family protein [Candidatus Omnitrophica bacterium]|nr:histidine phosphatase family protein [Candidatus Omnitrophota bacterium]
MNLYIVRHGESTWNQRNKIQGTSDPGLSKLGKLQARLLARRFNKVRIDRLYSSPLSRAQETARIISRELRLRIIKEKDLSEVGLGKWEGMTPDEIDRQYGNKYKKWLKLGPTKVAIDGAEGITHFRGRVKKVFGEIVRKNRDRDVMVVTHGGVIASFLADILEADFDKLILSLHLPNTCVTLVSFERDRGCLIHIADTFHLSLAKLKGNWPV